MGVWAYRRMGETAHRDGRNQNLVRAPFQGACRYRHTQGLSRLKPWAILFSHFVAIVPISQSPHRRFAVSPPGSWILAPDSSDEHALTLAADLRRSIVPHSCRISFQFVRIRRAPRGGSVSWRASTIGNTWTG
jgi:hypothetical protein